MTQTATFDEARQICAQDFPGARVIAVKSQETVEFLKNFVKQHGDSWLGATDRIQPRGFKWIDGFGNYEDLTLKNWDDGEPNDYGGREDCVLAE